MALEVTQMIDTNSEVRRRITGGSDDMRAKETGSAGHGGRDAAIRRRHGMWRCRLDKHHVMHV